MSRSRKIMEGENEGEESEQQNPLAVVQLKLREAGTRFSRWLTKQPLPVEAAIATVTGTAIGAATGALVEVACSLVTQQPLEAVAVSARNYGVMIGTQYGIDPFMTRLRGKQSDVQSWMVAGFCGGASYSLVSGVGLWGPNQHAANVVTHGLLHGLAYGGFHQLLEKFSQPPMDDSYYSETRWMLDHLGLDKYENSFKKGLLTDRTLHLLTDSALRDVKIPPGPRLRILDHVDRDPELKDRRKSSTRARGSSRDLLKYYWK